MSKIQYIESFFSSPAKPQERLQLFKDVLEAEAELTQEFQSLKKAELLKKISPMLASRCKTERKDILARRAFSHLLDRFVVGRTVAFNPGFTSESFKTAKRAGILAILEGDVR